MPTRVFFLDNEVLIDSVPMPFVAGSLMAVMSGSTVAIQRIDGAFTFVSIDWTDVADQNGDTFASGADAMAYLATELAKRRAIGESFDVTMVAGMDLATGQPVAVSRATGQLMAARADTYALSFLAGLVTTATEAGFATRPANGAVTFADWTAVTGASALTPGCPYFLEPAGGLSLVPPSTPGCCVVRVGRAASATTLIVQPGDPITL